MRRIDPRPAHIVIARAGLLRTRLAWRGARMVNKIPLFRQHFQGFGINGCFWKPHALGLASEAAFKISDPPLHLRDLIAPVRQRKDHVVVSLRDGGAMSGESLPAVLVRFKNRRIARSEPVPSSRTAASDRS